jgi:hypothetical protein
LGAAACNTTPLALLFRLQVVNRPILMTLGHHYHQIANWEEGRGHGIEESAEICEIVRPLGFSAVRMALLAQVVSAAEGCPPPGKDDRPWTRVVPDCRQARGCDPTSRVCAIDSMRSRLWTAVKVGG